MEQFLMNNSGSAVLALVLFFVYGRLKTQILADAKAARGEGEKREVGPQPFDVRVTKEPFDGERFEKAEAERKEDRAKILDQLEQIRKEQVRSNRYQAKARQGIHRRQNAFENALSYMAGKAEAAGDVKTARFVRDRLNQAIEEHSQEADDEA